MMTRRTSKLSNARAKAGFTLVEAMVGITATSLVMLGVVNLYLGAFKLQVRAMADATSGQNAALGLQRVENTMHEAYFCVLPPDTTHVSLYTFLTGLVSLAGSGITLNTGNVATRFSGYTTANFISSSGTNTCYSGIISVYPVVGSAASILTASGGTPTAPPTPYDPTQVPTNCVIFYRSDSKGNPNATSGGYLWETGFVNGVPIDRAIVRDIDTNAWNAVEFARPVTPSGTYSMNQIQVRLITGEYSPTNTMQTSDESNGTNASDMAGKVINLNNYDQTGNSDSTTYTAPNGVSFQHS